MFLLGFILPGTFCASWRLGWLFPFPCSGSFQLLFLQIFSQVLSLFSFWDSYNADVGAFNVVPEVSQAVFVYFHSFSCILFCGSDFHYLSSRSSICYSASVILLLISSSSVLAWRIPGTEEPDGLPSMGLHRVGHDWSDLAAAAVYYSSLFFQVFGKYFLHLLSLCLHSLPESLDHFHYHFLNSFSGRLPIFTQPFFWGFILSLHLGHNFLFFNMINFL